MVRAKFAVAEITQSGWGKDDSAANYRSHRVVLQPQYDTTIPEDQRFQQATPSGFMEMQIDNPAALAQFKIGQQF